VLLSHTCPLSRCQQIRFRNPINDSRTAEETLTLFSQKKKNIRGEPKFHFQFGKLLVVKLLSFSLPIRFMRSNLAALDGWKNKFEEFLRLIIFDVFNLSCPRTKRTRNVSSNNFYYDKNNKK